MKYTIEYWKNKGTPLFDKMPTGWSVCVGATTSPIGYVWICNNKSLFDGIRKHGLLKEKVK